MRTVSVSMVDLLGRDRDKTDRELSSPVFVPIFLCFE